MRTCGGCTLCCKLVPVEELGKPANHRCKHQRFARGCLIYAKRPFSCREWNCLWLAGTEDGGALQLSRPDHSGYVLDEVPDIVQVRDNVTGKVVDTLDVLQVWVDPKRRDAWKDPALLAMLERQSVVALIRYSATEGFTLFPPSRTADHQWHEEGGGSTAVTTMETARFNARVAFWSRQAKEQARFGDHVTGGDAEGKR